MFKNALERYTRLGLKETAWQKALPLPSTYPWPVCAEARLHKRGRGGVKKGLSALGYIASYAEDARVKVLCNNGILFGPSITDIMTCGGWRWGRGWGSLEKGKNGRWPCMAATWHAPSANWSSGQHNERGRGLATSCPCIRHQFPLLAIIYGVGFSPARSPLLTVGMHDCPGGVCLSISVFWLCMCLKAFMRRKGWIAPIETYVGRVGENGWTPEITWLATWGGGVSICVTTHGTE